MATPKTWTADDIQQGKLTLHRVVNEFGQQAIQLERRYVFVDSVGDVLTDIAGGKLLEVVAIADIPASVVSALQTIDDWTYSQSLAQEGMT